MKSSTPDEELDPEAARVLTRVRRLMGISVVFTGVAVAAVLAVIGYRVSRNEGSRPAAPQVQASLPAGAKVMSTVVGEDRIIVTVEVAGRAQVHVFDLQTLQPRGRIAFDAAP
jgi:hypothetical protein